MERVRVVPLVQAHHGFLQEKRRVFGSLQRHPGFVMQPSRDIATRSLEIFWCDRLSENVRRPGANLQVKDFSI